MGLRTFHLKSFVITVILFLVKKLETVQVSPCQGDCERVMCPTSCDCMNRTVDCHGRNLTYIPRIPCGISYLNLSNSNINKLSIDETNNLTCSFGTLTHLSLRDCKITLFDEDVFSNLTQLEVLDLSFNKLVSHAESYLHSLARSLGSLNRAPLRTLHLDHLLIQDGVKEIFKYFEGRNLTRLSMRENQIIQFEDKDLENFTKLLHLDLHSNWINKINLSSGIQTLQLFNLSHNQINIFPPNFCDTKTGKTRYKNLTNLDLSWNQIILPYSPNWNCLIALEALNLSKNNMEDMTGNYSFANLTSLKSLILSEMHSTMRKIRSDALQSDSLIYLDLSGNGLNFEDYKEVAHDIFDRLPQLTSLDVSRNDFASVGVQKLTVLSNLEKLIMRGVYLRQLPNDFLRHFPNLTYLDLSRNKIENFSVEAFQGLTKLKVLNISDNLVSNFPAPPFPEDTLKSLNKFDFAYNYFQCDCDLLELQEWINRVLSDPNKTHLFSRFPDDYWCYTPHSLYHMTLKDVKPANCSIYKNQLVLIVLCVVSSASVCLVFTVVLVVSYIYRWEIKFLLHKMRQTRRDGYHPLTYTFEYNTYLAYAEKDSAWVIHDLLKELEEFNYYAYIRDRNSVPGVARCDEIVDNIYKSKTVILVLSKNFMACQWCTYQLNVAQARAIKLGPHFLIPVLLEGVDSKDMKKSVQHLFRTSKPIEWARQSTKNRLFWSELKTALDAEINHDFEETGYQSRDCGYASMT